MNHLVPEILVTLDGLQILLWIIEKGLDDLYGWWEERNTGMFSNLTNFTLKGTRVLFFINMETSFLSKDKWGGLIYDATTLFHHQKQK